MPSREQVASEDKLAHARVTYAEELCGLTCSDQSILHVYLNGREKLPHALGARGVQRRRGQLASAPAAMFTASSRSSYPYGTRGDRETRRCTHPARFSQSIRGSSLSRLAPTLALVRLGKKLSHDRKFKAHSTVATETDNPLFKEPILVLRGVGV